MLPTKALLFPLLDTTASVASTYLLLLCKLGGLDNPSCHQLP